jgi:hypothetical protein
MKTKNLKRKQKRRLGGSLEPVGWAFVRKAYEHGIGAARAANGGTEYTRTWADTSAPAREGYRALVAFVIKAVKPNTELSSGGPADKRQQTEQAARRLLK